jgi:hypothetical protein
MNNEVLDVNNSLYLLMKVTIQFLKRIRMESKVDKGTLWAEGGLI